MFFKINGKHRRGKNKIHSGYLYTKATSTTDYCFIINNKNKIKFDIAKTEIFQAKASKGVCFQDQLSLTRVSLQMAFQMLFLFERFSA
jgi:hypothetical protein